MFAITPRSVGLINHLNDFMDPFCLQRTQLPVQFFDRALNHRDSELGLAGDSHSQTKYTDKGFFIRLDLSNYQPEEVKISSNSKTITVQARHKEEQDSHGYILHEIKRVYKLPNDVDPKSATSIMNADGVLSIKVTKNAVEASEAKAIPVEFEN